MPFSRKPPSLKARALQALALREHSRSELRRKLLRPVRQRPGAGSPPAQGGEPGGPTEPGPATNPHSTSAEVDALLDELQAQGLRSGVGLRADTSGHNCTAVQLHSSQSQPQG